MAANQEIHKIATEILNESRALVPFQDGILSGSGHLKAGGAGSNLVMSQTVEYDVARVWHISPAFSIGGAEFAPNTSSGAVPAVS